MYVYLCFTIIFFIMKNFVKFLKAYEALKEARKDAFMFSEKYVCEYREDEFRANRRKVVINIDLGIDALLEWFDENFPRTTADAAQCECFYYPAFFDMLKKHSELVISNEEILQGLLCSLKAKGLYGTGLDSFPTLDEFIPEEMKLKVAKATEAIELLHKIEDSKLKEKIRPILECLEARRPHTREAFVALLKLSGASAEDEEILRQTRICLKNA